MKKSNGSTGTLYWYSAVGVVAESDLSGTLQHEYIFFGGRRIARKDLPANTISYYFSDHLKTAAVITDSTGNIKSESDLTPWGGELQFVNNDSNDYKFTGKKHDPETGLDYFGARYYGSAFGRFVTPDWSAGPATVPYAHLDNPQTLNQYGYVDNNPVNGIDPDGHAQTHEYMLGGPGWDLSGVTSDGTGETTDAGIAISVPSDQPQTLNLKQVQAIIEKAQASHNDPVTTAINIFNALGNNVTVSGSILSEAIAGAKGLTLDSSMKAIIDNAQSITKTGNTVTVQNQGARAIPGIGATKDAKGKIIDKGTNLYLDQKVSFQVVTGKSPSIQHLEGVKSDLLGPFRATIDSIRPGTDHGNAGVFVHGHFGLISKEKFVPFPE